MYVYGKSCPIKQAPIQLSDLCLPRLNLDDIGGEMDDCVSVLSCWMVDLLGERGEGKYVSGRPFFQPRAGKRVVSHI